MSCYRMNYHHCYCHCQVLIAGVELFDSVNSVNLNQSAFNSLHSGGNLHKYIRSGFISMLQWLFQTCRKSVATWQCCTAVQKFTVRRETIFFMAPIQFVSRNFKLMEHNNLRWKEKDGCRETLQRTELELEIGCQKLSLDAVSCRSIIILKYDFIIHRLNFFLVVIFWRLRKWLFNSIEKEFNIFF